MFKNSVNFVRKVARDLRNNRIAQGVALMGSTGAAFAQASGGSSIDVSSALAAIAAGLAAGLLVSVAFTGAKLTIRSAKLPRSA